MAQHISILERDCNENEEDNAIEEVSDEYIDEQKDPNFDFQAFYEAKIVLILNNK